MKARLSMDSEIFTRGVEDIVTRDGLKELLRSGRKLRIKFGADVTATDLHLGHAVNLWKMRYLQDHGHKVVFLIGDFTTMVGDPTGRMEARKKASLPDINKWAENFIEQVGLVLRTDKAVFEVRRNSEWYSRMSAAELFELMSLFTHARLVERDMFQKRMAAGKEILFPELLYPILQGYDSVMLKSDLTIIGTDQLFNENAGRFLQEKFRQPPQVLVTTTITPGLDGGGKMSKSLGNYIGLSDAPRDKFGKIMRIPDSLVMLYLKVYTDVGLEDVRRIEDDLERGRNPMEAKLFLAERVVERYHGKLVAKKERAWFLSSFSKKGIVSDVPEFAPKKKEFDIVSLLLETKKVGSKSEARRLIKQGAIEIGGRRVKNVRESMLLKGGEIIRIGKKIFIKVKQ